MYCFQNCQSSQTKQMSKLAILVSDHCRGCRNSPDFGRLVNPISTGEGSLPLHPLPPDCQTFQHIFPASGKKGGRRNCNYKRLQKQRYKRTHTSYINVRVHLFRTIKQIWSFMENNDEWVIAHFQKAAALSKQNTKSWLHTLTTYGSMY